jgi:hypothetical protein
MAEAQGKIEGRGNRYSAELPHGALADLAPEDFARRDPKGCQHIFQSMACLFTSPGDSHPGWCRNGKRPAPHAVGPVLRLASPTARRSTARGPDGTAMPLAEDLTGWRISTILGRDWQRVRGVGPMAQYDAGGTRELQSRPSVHCLEPTHPEHGVAIGAERLASGRPFHMSSGALEVGLCWTGSWGRELLDPWLPGSEEQVGSQEVPAHREALQTGGRAVSWTSFCVALAARSPAGPATVAGRTSK